jgi:tetratricopeptide (TPR) repeat protein
MLRRVVLSAAAVAAVGTAVAVLWPRSSGSPDDPAAAGGALPIADSIELFEGRAESDPRDAVSRTVLGELYAQLGRETGSNEAYARSAATLEEALDLLPEYTPAQQALARTNLSRHRFDEAIGLAEGVLADDPDESNEYDALATLVDAELGLGRVDEARQDLARLLALGETSGALVRQAQFLEMTGRQDEAMTTALQALQTAEREGLSGERLAWFNWRVGDLHRHVGDVDGAEEYFRAALDIYPGFHLASEGLGDVASVRGDHTAALGWYEEARKVRPDDPALLLTIAGTHEALGDEDAAERLAEEAVEGWSPELDRNVWGADYASVFADLGVETDLAVELARDNLANRQDPGSWELYARTLLQAGDLEEARVAADKALVHGQQEPDWLVTSALVWEGLGRVDLARADLERAVDINPTHQPSVELLGALDGP